MPNNSYVKRKIKGKTFQVHRLVMEELLGRKLRRDEDVHHVNENPKDNRPENLRVLSREQHSRLHNDKHPRVKRCEVCGAEFTPAPTKRKRQKACSVDCARVLMSRAAVEREERKRAEARA